MIAQSESVAKLAASLVKAHAEMENPTKDKANAHHKYKYATLEALLEVAKPVLARHGLTVVQMPTGIDEAPALVTVLMHESGEYMRSEMPLTMLRPDKMLGPQALGSAITYARRYALQAVLGVTAEDDDDGQAASNPPKQQQQPQQAKPQQQWTDAQMDQLLAAKNWVWNWVVGKINKDDGTSYKDGTQIPDARLFAFFDWLKTQPAYIPKANGGAA